MSAAAIYQKNLSRVFFVRFITEQRQMNNTGRSYDVIAKLYFQRSTDNQLIKAYRLNREIKLIQKME